MKHHRHHEERFPSPRARGLFCLCARRCFPVRVGTLCLSEGAFRQASVPAGRRGGTRFFRRCLSGAGALLPGRGRGGKVLFLLLCRGNPDAMRLRGAGRQGFARELPARAGRGVFSEEVPWQAHGNVPACTPLTAGNHEGRLIRRRHRPAVGEPGGRSLFFSVRCSRPAPFPPRSAFFVRRFFHTPVDGRRVFPVHGRALRYA